MTSRRGGGSQKRAQKKPHRVEEFGVGEKSGVREGDGRDARGAQAGQGDEGGCVCLLCLLCTGLWLVWNVGLCGDGGVGGIIMTPLIVLFVLSLPPPSLEPTTKQPAHKKAPKTTKTHRGG